MHSIISVTSPTQPAARAAPSSSPSARGDTRGGSRAWFFAWLCEAQRRIARHWPEYLMDAAGLGLFMIAACAFAVLFQYPGSAVHQAVSEPRLRRVLMGVAMGLTAISIIYSPLGKRSGAHLNPAVTLTFLRLRKVEGWDAVFYTLAQFAGGALGVLVATVMVGQMLVGHAAVRYVATLPGAPGRWVAFGAETTISFGLMLAVLTVSNRRRLNRYTGLLAGALVAIYISVEAPLSGMSMNPARTLASALSAHVWTDIWIYFLAPPAGMLLAAELYRSLNGAESILCCKLHHEKDSRCIFRCRYHVAGEG